MEKVAGAAREGKKEPALREAERAESEVIVIFQRVYSSVDSTSPGKIQAS